ncbi:MAG: SEC-C metal-binding domain-containing protein [Elusimicrobiota bacterium]
MMWNPLKGIFGGKRVAESGAPQDKGMMSLFYRKWKDPAFIKQMKVLAAHMSKDGVNIKNMGEVKAWVEKNKDAIEAGRYTEPPASSAAKPETYVKSTPDVGRNDPCPCGSGKKYKKCCAAKG